MRHGKISMNHADFKDLSYESYLQKISLANVNSKQSTDITHNFELKSAYEITSSPIMPYTNYTYDDICIYLRFIRIKFFSFCSFFRYEFKGIIDYVFFSSHLMRVLGVLGPLDPEWLQTNKIVGCPHPNVPSDHFSLLVEFELNPIIPSDTSTSNNNNNNNNNNNSQISATPISTRR